MFHAVFILKEAFDLIQYPVTFGNQQIIDQNMGTHGVYAGSNGPQMQVMHIFHALDSQEVVYHSIHIYLLGRCLKEDINGFFHQTIGPPADQHADKDTDSGVYHVPARVNDH